MRFVIQKIAEFMSALLDEVRTRHAEQRSEHQDMSRTVTSILALLTAQGAQIDQLVAQRDAADQADLETIGAAIEANTDKVAAALVPPAANQAPAGDAGATTVAVSAPTTAPTKTVPISGGVDSASVGSTVTGPGLAAGTTLDGVAPDGSLVLSQPTAADHAGDGTELLTVTPAAAATPVAAAA